MIENLTVTCPDIQTVIQATLDSYWAQGWKLVGTVSDGTNVTMYFKRVKVKEEQ